MNHTTTLRHAFENATVSRGASPSIVKLCLSALRRGVGTTTRRQMWSVNRRGKR